MAYLVKNFGPGAKPRNVRTVQETPLDEAKLGKAMYMEYYVPGGSAGGGDTLRRSIATRWDGAGASFRTCGSTRRATCGRAIAEPRAGWSSSIRAPAR